MLWKVLKFERSMATETREAQVGGCWNATGNGIIVEQLGAISAIRLNSSTAGNHNNGTHEILKPNCITLLSRVCPRCANNKCPWEGTPATSLRSCLFVTRNWSAA
jgi:hypothetical protein